MRAVRKSASVIACSVVVGFLSCREPTQITVRVTTDADCPEGAQRPRVNDIVIVTARKIELGTKGNPQPVPVANAVTKQCAAEDGTNTIGTLVLLPDGGDDQSVEVMVVAGVQRDETDDGEHSMSASQCADLAFTGDSVEGQPCIVARRRLTFIDHESLVMPVELDRRCIGEDCGSDLTCFEGNCVSPDVVCSPDDPECDPPEGCVDECELSCTSGNATCQDNTCVCLECKDEECAGADCGLGSVGACNEDKTACTCLAACDPAACATECEGGTCEGADCVCPICSDANCSGPCNGGAGTSQCADVEGQLSCVCIGACDEASCTAGEDCPDGQLGECTTIPRGEACVCSCDDDECAADCSTGCGACEDGACSCTAQCSLDTCGPCPAGKVATCADPCGGCSCSCDETACDQLCGPIGGTCVTSGGADSCECNNPTTSTGMAGNGGNGGSTSSIISTSSNGGMAGQGGTTSSIISTSSNGGMAGQGGIGSGPASSSSGIGGGLQMQCALPLITDCADCPAACAQSFCQFAGCTQPPAGGFVNCQCSLP
ncbi:MAG: hypothetical protein HOW73_01220 [Polyangiaceae bacterium]|nr:hypothetical protein [Polyangiaceae bacterium]